MRGHCLVSLLSQLQWEEEEPSPRLQPGSVLYWRLCYTQGHTTLGETTAALAWLKHERLKELGKPLNPLEWRKDLNFPLCCMPNILWAKGSCWRQLGAVNCCLHFGWKFSARWVEIMKNLEWQVCHDLRLGNSRCWVSFSFYFSSWTFAAIFLLHH